MRRRPPSATLTPTLFPSTTLFRSLTRTEARGLGRAGRGVAVVVGSDDDAADDRRNGENSDDPARTTFEAILFRNSRGRARAIERRCSRGRNRSEEHTSELQSLMRISYAVFCLKKKNITATRITR